jgi:hypothetical protein
MGKKGREDREPKAARPGETRLGMGEALDSAFAERQAAAAPKSASRGQTFGPAFGILTPRAVRPPT